MSAGPDRSGQPIERVVGDLQRLCVLAKSAHRQYRAEDLLAAHPHVRPHRVEHRGFDVVAAAVAQRLLAAEGHARALGDAGIDVASTRLRWPLSISAPICVAGSNGWPSVMVRATRSMASISRRAPARARSGASRRGRSRRRCNRCPRRSPAAACSRSASAITRCGLLPPSSSATRLRLDSPA
jgi:hypothetical protein